MSNLTPAFFVSPLHPHLGNPVHLVGWTWCQWTGLMELVACGNPMIYPVGRRERFGAIGVFIFPMKNGEPVGATWTFSSI